MDSLDPDKITAAAGFHSTLADTLFFAYECSPDHQPGYRVRALWRYDRSCAISHIIANVNSLDQHSYDEKT